MVFNVGTKFKISVLSLYVFIVLLDSFYEVKLMLGCMLLVYSKNKPKGFDSSFIRCIKFQIIKINKTL